MQQLRFSFAFRASPRAEQDGDIQPPGGPRVTSGEMRMLKHFFWGVFFRDVFVERGGFGVLLGAVIGLLSSVSPYALEENLLF